MPRPPLHSLTQYQTRSSKEYAEQSKAVNFLRDNVADKLNYLFQTNLKN